MAETSAVTDTSEDEEFHDACDSFVEEEGAYSTIDRHPGSDHQHGSLPPGEMVLKYVGTDTVSLGWTATDDIVRCKYQLTYSCKTQTESLNIRDPSVTDVKGLLPGTEYTFCIRRIGENGDQSQATSVAVFTESVPPETVRVDQISGDTASLSWDTPAGDVGGYIVSSSRDLEDLETAQEVETESNVVKFSGLTPGALYSFRVSTKLRNGSFSKPALVSACTKTYLESFLEDLGLEQHYTDKLSLSSVLQIGERTISDVSAKCLSDLPWCFMKSLMMVNVTARNVKCTSVSESGGDCSFDSIDNIADSATSGNMLNPLDIVTALFLCSNGLLQQEMAVKMSMCQFSLPLLLPDCEKKQCTLMLWAMRDIVKKYRPHSLGDPKSFIEERVVLSELPLVSFVRFGECSLSKSEILNKLLSNSQQYHDTFVHHNMECGDIPRKIADGLVEISWYLPCGNKNIDIFGEPVAVANLRGDMACCETQFCFLCHISAAVFVFFDNLDNQCRLLTNQPNSTQLFLVGNAQSKTFNLNDLKRVAAEINLTKDKIVLKTKGMNDAGLAQRLRNNAINVVKNSKKKIRIEQMADIAHELGILVDEDAPECQMAKQNADAITEKIQDTLQYKEEQLPLQGKIWKELTRLEKEECRLRKAGEREIEMYKSDLQEKKIKLRKDQNRYDISDAMTCFIQAISNPGAERCYFLKWMRINLDNLSREKLSDLRQEYKENCQKPENKEEMKVLDERLSNSSLGIEHFFREMGQLYESAVSLPETEISRQQFQHLPKLCAQLLLDGFPLELVDGDASNIPLKWIESVLSQLSVMLNPNSKILVVTVLGVQSTGKSTLLNTMFGVQFAVSSGRCTRGAFMVLIGVNEELKEELNCDFLVIIDTEGLKSPELAQLDDSYEHDNELATLVVGLSDVTIINIAMENLTEMKDILQIVVHAFLRMKEVGKKPKCQFVHQNVSDVSAYDKNLRDRKLLLEQLNEMTQAAAKMEKKDENKSFTDVMEYDPETGNWYIPGLWHGNPPMAPVNAGYSEAVYELKKNIIHILGKCKSSANNINEFLVWTTSLWNAVKHENFIFSFRNSLVADAYMRLCTEFNKWEWDFKKQIYTWVMNTETKIWNFGTVGAKSKFADIGEFVAHLKTEACSELSKWETTLLENLARYFEQTDGHVYLVERYREDFANSVKCLRNEMERSVFSQMTATADIKQGKAELDRVKENQTIKLEKEVLRLIEECRSSKSQSTDEELDREFDKMWEKTLRQLNIKGLKKEDIFAKVDRQLRMNLKQKGGHANELVSSADLRQCGTKDFIVKAEGLWHKFKYHVLHIQNHIKDLQMMADKIISTCTQLALEKKRLNTNYHDNYTLEILRIIDKSLKDSKTGIEFEVSLKQQVCGGVARIFQQMHEYYITINDPFICLDQHKEKYRLDFKDLFHERDQCQKKAEEFTKQCLRPAVETCITNSLGTAIVDEMLRGSNSVKFSTRTFFQYSILKDLLSENNFEKYASYTDSYEDFVKQWIREQIVKHFSNGSRMFELEDRHLKASISSIKKAIEKAQMNNDSELVQFVQDICKELANELVIPQDALGAFMILNNAKQEQFANWLTQSVEDMGKELQKTINKREIQTRLEELRVKPQNELFTKLIGCGKQCPFCKAPCEAGGEAHSQHCASIHRPEGLGRYRYSISAQLIADICSSSVASEKQFKCFETKSKFYPFKQYRDIFPTWEIPADNSIEATDYWKYVMTRFNTQFAKRYAAKPADIPAMWKSISKEQAEKTLMASFGIK